MNTKERVEKEGTNQFLDDIVGQGVLCPFCVAYGTTQTLCVLEPNDDEPRDTLFCPHCDCTFRLSVHVPKKLSEEWVEHVAEYMGV